MEAGKHTMKFREIPWHSIHIQISKEIHGFFNANKIGMYLQPLVSQSVSAADPFV